ADGLDEHGDGRRTGDDCQGGADVWRLRVGLFVAGGGAGGATATARQGGTGSTAGGNRPGPCGGGVSAKTSPKRKRGKRVLPALALGAGFCASGWLLIGGGEPFNTVPGPKALEDGGVGVRTGGTAGGSVRLGTAADVLVCVHPHRAVGPENRRGARVR